MTPASQARQARYERQWPHRESPCLSHSRSYTFQGFSVEGWLSKGADPIGDSPPRHFCQVLASQISFQFYLSSIYSFYTAKSFSHSNQTGQLFWALPPVFGLFAFKLAVHVRAVVASMGSDPMDEFPTAAFPARVSQPQIF